MDWSAGRLVNIQTRFGLPFAEIVLVHQNQSIASNRFLVDTGSAATLISADLAVQIGLGPSPNDVIREIVGVGGSEYVYEKKIEAIQFGTKRISNFRIQIGAMDYGFDMDGIIGYDLLTHVRSLIDLNNMTIE
jgi:predicted aspartyl protease